VLLLIYSVGQVSLPESGGQGEEGRQSGGAKNMDPPSLHARGRQDRRMEWQVTHTPSQKGREERKDTWWDVGMSQSITRAVCPLCFLLPYFIVFSL